MGDEDRIRTEELHEEEDTTENIAPEDYVPFPVEALPDSLRTYTGVASRAIGCDPAHVALPLLATMAGAIGNSRCILLKRSWTEPAIIWTATVARSGAWKSPALHAVLRPVYELQEKKLDEYREELAQWEAERQAYQDAKAARRHGEPPPRRPETEEPRPVEYLADDITTESLALLLRDNPRGVLGAPEELSGFFGSLDAYKRGHLDGSRWLRMYDGRTLKVNRKTGERKDCIVFVPRAAVSLTGTVQPGVLMRCATAEHYENGMMARFILAAPPLVRPEWTEASIPADVEERYGALLERLFRLRGLREDGVEPGPGEKVESVRPAMLCLEPAAKVRWVEFFNEFRFEEDDRDPRQSALWAKAVGRAARFALVHHVVQEVSAGREAVTPIGVVSVEAGIALARWSLAEGSRVYAVLKSEALAAGGGANRDGHRDEDEDLAAWIGSRGGRCRTSDLKSGPRRFRKDPGPEARLERLGRRGLGRWTVEPGRGRPPRVFVVDPEGGPGGAEWTRKSENSAENETSSSRSNGSNNGSLPPDHVTEDALREPGDEGDEEAWWSPV